MRRAPFSRPLEAPEVAVAEGDALDVRAVRRAVNSCMVIVLPTLRAKASTPAGGT